MQRGLRPQPPRGLSPPVIAAKRGFQHSQAPGRRVASSSASLKSCDASVLAHPPGPPWRKPPCLPLAPAIFPQMPAIPGRRDVRHSGGWHPLQGSDRRPVLTLFERNDRRPACSRKSKCPSAPVDWCRKALQGGKARGLVVNSRQRERVHGQDRRGAVKLTAEIAPRRWAAAGARSVLASTGVIGEPLDATKFNGVLADCDQRADGRLLERAGQGHHDHRHLPQGCAARSAEIDGVTVPSPASPRARA